MSGLLRSQGIVVGENRIGRSMQRVAPTAQIGRQRRAGCHLNPPPYTARFFGDKIHLDQNEKNCHVWSYPCNGYRWVQP